MLLIDTYASPLYEHADLVVNSSVGSVLPLDSLAPAVAQIEALVATLVTRVGTPLNGRLESTDQLHNTFNSHLLEE